MTKTRAKPKPRSTTIIAYDMVPHDANSWYLPEKPPSGVQCPECSSPLDRNFISPQCDIKGKHEVLATYDGHFIVNARFRRFCLENGYRNIDFVLADPKRGYYDLRPRQLLEIDVARSKPVLSSKCGHCGQYICVNLNETAGIHFKNVDSALPDGFYRSDVLFACGHAKAPLFVVGIETARKIKAAAFKRILFLSLPDCVPRRTLE